MLTRLRALIIKELLNILRDPKSRTVLIVPPVIQIFIFSFAMTMEAKNVHLGVLNLDAGRAGFEKPAGRPRSNCCWTAARPIRPRSSGATPSGFWTASWPIAVPKPPPARPSC